MYCVKCGVELQKGAESCPLCGLRVYHPEIAEEPEAPLYPRGAAEETVSHGGLLFVVSFLFVIPLIICLLIDRNMNGSISWSGIVACGLLTGYVVFCLPLWFKRPNPVIFFPAAVLAALGLCLYICLVTGGRWFLSFAFPVVGLLALIAETMIVLLRYTLRGKSYRALYIVGGALIALGGACVLIEFLLYVSFALPMRGWSAYPLTALFLIGLMLIIIAACPPWRRSLHKKFFI